MDPTIVGALIAAVATVVAAWIVSRKRRHGSGVEGPPAGESDEENPPEDGKLPTKLFIVLGEGHLGPIDLGLYIHLKPETLTSKAMDEAFEIPQSMRTEAPRQVYWHEGQKFLSDNAEYWSQGVRPQATLVLTDVPDKQIVAAIADGLISQAKRRHESG